MRWRLLFLTLLGGLLGHLSAGQSLVSGVEGAEEWAKPQIEIADTWRVRGEVISMGQSPVGQKELDHIVELRDHYRFTSFPEVSVALLREAQEVRRTFPDRAETLINYAEKISPGLVTIDYFHCNLGASPRGMWESIQRCVKGFQNELRTTDGQFRALSDFVTVFLAAIALAALLFAIYLILKYAAPVSHVWAHKLRGLAPSTVMALTLALMFASWLAIGGWGPAILILFLLWRHMDGGERFVTTLLWILGLTIPALFYFPALYFQYEKGIGALLESPLEGVVGLPDRATRLQAWLVRNPDDAEALLVAAKIDRSTGRLRSARELLVRANKARPQWHKPVTNMATLDFLESNNAAAIAHLQQAIALAPQTMVPQFNLGKIFYKETRLDEGLAALKKAKNIDPSTFATLDKISVEGDPNRFLVDETLGSGELFERIWRITPDVTSARDGIQAEYFPLLPPLAYWILLVLAYIGAVIYSSLRPPPRLPKACSKCGVPSCGFCDPAIERESLCVQCYHIFVRLESIDPEARRQKDRQIARYRFLRDVRERWSGILIPGFHAFFRGTYGRATLFLLLGAGFLVASFQWGSFLLSPFAFVGLPVFPGIWFAALGLAIVYSISIMDATRR